MKTDRIQGIIISEPAHQANFVSQKIKKLSKRLQTVRKSITKQQDLDFSPKMSRKHVDKHVEDLLQRLRIRDY